MRHGPLLSIIAGWLSALVNLAFATENLAYSESTVLAYDGSVGDALGEAFVRSDAWLVAGASGESNGLGAAYAFKRKPDLTWDDAVKITPPGSVTDSFGVSLAMDDTQLVVGANGAIYFYEASGDGRWVFVKTFTDSTLAAVEDAVFGGSVAVEEKKIMAAGCSNQCTNITLWDWDDESSEWGSASPTTLVTGIDSSAVPDFGYSLVARDSSLVALSRSTTYAFHYFYYDNTLAQWSVKNVPLPDSSSKSSIAITSDEAEQTASKAITFDGTTAVVGLPALRRVLLYEFDSSALTWTCVQSIKTPSGTSDVDSFGASVAVRGDELIVGAPDTDEVTVSSSQMLSIGAAYIYSKNASLPTGSQWAFVHAFANNADTVAANDRFGSCVALGDRSYAMSSPGYSNDQGVLYSYEGTTRKPTAFPTPFPTYSPTPRPTVRSDTTTGGSDSPSGSGVSVTLDTSLSGGAIAGIVISVLFVLAASVGAYRFRGAYLGTLFSSDQPTAPVPAPAPAPAPAHPVDLEKNEGKKSKARGKKKKAHH